MDCGSVQKTWNLCSKGTIEILSILRTQSDFDNAFSSAAIVSINKPIFGYLFVLISYFFGRQSTLEPRPAL
jgi:hypothetical protein